MVDASVPEHVRNDPHILEAACRQVGISCFGSYEFWASDRHGQPGSPAESAFIAQFLSNPFDFDPSILQQPTNDAQAPVPIARLFDTDTYTGADPNVTTGQAIGIAEVANANFFSEDTTGGQYPFPDITRLVAFEQAAPETGRPRRYFAAADGLRASPLRAECALFRLVFGRVAVEPIMYQCMDESVWEATATHMLPRAVGYARGVLDYFFRGRIEIAAPDRYAYALAPFQDGNTGSFTKLRFKIRNATPEEETGEGQVFAVVQYRRPAGNIFETPDASLSSPFFAVSPGQTVTLTRTFQELVFDFSQSPIPTNSADVFLTVVYRGPLGLEPDAVIVSGKDLFEPDPFDWANVTDYDCFNDEPYQVSQLPPFDPPTNTQRDVNGDNVQDLFGPWTERTNFVKTFPLDQPAPTPSETNFDATFAEQTYAQYNRFVVLQDQLNYGFALRSQRQEFSTGFVSQDLDAFAFVANRNFFSIDGAGRLVRHVTLTGQYRGLTFLKLFRAVASGNVTSFCLDQTDALPPDLTRIPNTLPPE